MYHDRNEYMLEIKNLLTVHVSGDFFHMHNSNFDTFFDMHINLFLLRYYFEYIERIKILHIYLTLEVLLDAHV